MTMRPSRTLRQASDLIGAGLVPEHQRTSIENVAARYAVAITPSLTELIDATDANDPIARQFVPDPAELANLCRSRHPLRLSSLMPSSSMRSAMTLW